MPAHAPFQPSTLDEEHVPDRLAKAWEFLSGEHREFVHVRSADSLHHTEFSYFMPLKFKNGRPDAGMGVLIEAADARAVASHMFGVPAHEVPQADLRDACAEVCNVFADAIASQWGEGAGVGLGLPVLADADEYARLQRANKATTVYCAVGPGTTLHVVVYRAATQGRAA